MDCRSKTGIDFCEDPSCGASTISAQGHHNLEEHHVPSHERFKVYQWFHSRYYAITERQAKEALSKARELLRSDADLKAGENWVKSADRVDEANGEGQVNGREEADSEGVVDRVADANGEGAVDRVPDANGEEGTDRKEEADHAEVSRYEKRNAEKETQQTDTVKRCVFCKTRVSLIAKCWFCIDCGMSTSFPSWYLLTPSRTGKR